MNILCGSTCCKYYTLISSKLLLKLPLFLPSDLFFGVLSANHFWYTAKWRSVIKTSIVFQPSILILTVIYPCFPLIWGTWPETLYLYYRPMTQNTYIPLNEYFRCSRHPGGNICTLRTFEGSKTVQPILAHSQSYQPDIKPTWAWMIL